MSDELAEKLRDLRAAFAYCPTHPVHELCDLVETEDAQLGRFRAALVKISSMEVTRGAAANLAWDTLYRRYIL